LPTQGGGGGKPSSLFYAGPLSQPALREFNMPHSSIDVALIGKPDNRRRLQALVADPGVTIDRVKAEAAGLGIDASRSAVARWIRTQRRGMALGSATLLAAVIRAVVELKFPELQKLAKRLKVRPSPVIRK